MEQEKGTVLNTVYIILLGLVFYLGKYIFVSDENVILRLLKGNEHICPCFFFSVSYNAPT